MSNLIGDELRSDKSDICADHFPHPPFQETDHKKAVNSLKLTAFHFNTYKLNYLLIHMLHIQRHSHHLQKMSA